MSVLYGFGEDYLLEGNDSYWPQLLALAAKWKFNTVRLAFGFPDSGVLHTSILDLVKLDALLSLLQSNGLKAVLDCHNYLDTAGYFGSDKWKQDWLSLAQHYKGDRRIAAFELFNEPPGGNNPNFWDSQKILDAYRDLTLKIRQIDPDRAVVWIGYIPGLDLMPYLFSHVLPNVTLTYHPWLSKLYTDAELLTLMQQYKTFAEQMQGWGYRVWNGEFGALFPDVEPWPKQMVWDVELINHGLTRSIGFSWWEYHRNFEASNPEYGKADAVLAASNYATPILRDAAKDAGVTLLGFSVAYANVKT